MGKTNLQLISYISYYCGCIANHIEASGCNADTFYQHQMCFQAVTMCLFQIGENANKLSEDFRRETQGQIPWHQIRGLRNVLAHAYTDINEDSLWETITSDIPQLKEFCDDLLRESQVTAETEFPFQESAEEDGDLEL